MHKQNKRITISHKTFITVLVSQRSLFTRYSYIVVQRYIAMITIQRGSPVGADAETLIISNTNNKDTIMAVLRLGDDAPNFDAETTEGNINAF